MVISRINSDRQSRQCICCRCRMYCTYSPVQQLWHKRRCSDVIPSGCTLVGGGDTRSQCDHRSWAHLCLCAHTQGRVCSGKHALGRRVCVFIKPIEPKKQRESGGPASIRLRSRSRRLSQYAFVIRRPRRSAAGVVFSFQEFLRS